MHMKDVNGSAFGVRAAATNLLKDWKEAQVRLDEGSIHDSISNLAEIRAGVVKA